MPQFTTISPTHISGQKPGAWERFREGHYVAIGWLEDVDLCESSPSAQVFRRLPSGLKATLEK